MKNRSCAFTGHRPTRFCFNYDEEDLRCKAIKYLLDINILLMLCRGVTRFYSGMALGVDMWAAEIVCELKRAGRAVELVAVLPCEGQAKRWPKAQRERHARILAEADEVVVISKDYTKTCMLERNRYMVDAADYLIAVYDGSGVGGTAYTVGYAEKRGRDIIFIDKNLIKKCIHI